jgi:hypothetical protein
MLKRLPWIMVFGGVVLALALLSREGRQAAAGNPSYLYTLLGQELLGLLYGGVFGLAGLLVGSFLRGFLEKFAEFRAAAGRRSPRKNEGKSRRQGDRGRGPRDT